MDHVLRNFNFSGSRLWCFCSSCTFHCILLVESS